MNNRRTAQKTYALCNCIHSREKRQRCTTRSARPKLARPNSTPIDFLSLATRIDVLPFSGRVGVVLLKGRWGVVRRRRRIRLSSRAVWFVVVVVVVFTRMSPPSKCVDAVFVVN